ncbi:MAG: OB-fold nucleic acid binding domain-containing protein [Rubrobacter sp.]|nr:OB-fold nucleic acid binding domain-containing protein [Rubrobacter sp.]
MKHMICVDSRGWEAVVRGATRYLFEGEATVACVVDERASSGYGLSVRGLLGRKPRHREELDPISQTEAENFLSEAAELLSKLRPGVSVETLILHGLPNEALASAATERGFETVFIGRGSPGADRPETISGTVSGWKRNHHGDLDGFFLEDGTEVRFPPHRASEIESVVREGSVVEVWGARRGRGFHAFEVSDGESKVEAHKPPGRGPEKIHLGHTARFVTDHVSCDVILIG